LGERSVFESIAIVGATGAVGKIIRRLLEERDFPYQKITFLASARSAGTTIDFRGEKHTVEELKPEAFDDIDLAIGSTPRSGAAWWSTRAVTGGWPPTCPWWCPR
jgi:aspartate-semialdehyde dehydrogenase